MVPLALLMAIATCATAWPCPPLPSTLAPKCYTTLGSGRRSWRRGLRYRRRKRVRGRWWGRRWRQHWHMLVDRQHCNVSTVPELLPEAAAATHTQSLCIPVRRRPASTRHLLKVCDVSIVIEASVTSRIVPLECAMAAAQVRGDAVSHLVNFTTPRGGRQVPALGVVLVQWLTIWIRIRRLTGCAWGCSLK